MPTNDMASKIKYLRSLYGLTLEDVATVVGVGKSTVRKWETGMIANMRRDKIALLAEALHTTPAYLMGWEETQPIEESPLFQRMIEETTEQPAVPEWYNELSEEDKALVQLIMKLPPSQKKILTDLAESWKPQQNGGTHGAGQQ